MFISNIENTSSKKYKCGEIIGNYLIKNGIVLLSRKDDIMYFSNTKKLRGVLNKMPIHLKLLVKVGVLNG